MNLDGLSLPRNDDGIRLKPDEDVIAIIRRSDGALLGRIVLSGSVGGDVEIDSLCIAEGNRGRGAGAAAIELLTASAAESGKRRLIAWAPPSNGLAVYFWQRSGFHPEFGARDGGGLVFVLDLA